jgi:phytoene synthase
MATRPELPPTRTLVSLYTPVAQRTAFAALCAIEAQIAASLDSRLDHEVAHARLAWWREECARAAQGRPTHPLTQALAASFAVFGLSAPTGISGFVDTATWDLAAATFETRAQLNAYCERWADAMITPLMQLAAAADADARSGVPGGATVPSARKLGAALCEVDLLANLAGDATHGRVRVSLADLAAAQAAPEQLAQPPWPAPLAAVLRTRQQQLRAQLAVAVGELPRHAQPALRGILVWARLAAAQSRRCERALPRALDPRDHPTRDHHRPQDSWWAWSAARRATAGRFAL